MIRWRAVVEAIKAERVDIVFGVPTFRSLHRYMGDVPEIKSVLVRHECSGAHALSSIFRKLHKRVSNS